ncbi:hypothetical protein COOONC_10471 [Cooperia oncophora]
MGCFFSTASSGIHTDLYRELEKTRIERQLAIAQLLEQRRHAYKLAEEREKLNWTASGGGIMMVFCALASYHHKNMLPLLPVFPTIGYLGYKAHYCYGNKTNIINGLSQLYFPSYSTLSAGCTKSNEGTERTETGRGLVFVTSLIRRFCSLFYEFSSFGAFVRCHRAPSMFQMGQTISTGGSNAAELKMLNDDFIEAEVVLKNLQAAHQRAVELIERQERFTWEFLGIGTMAVVLLAAGAFSKRKYIQDFAIPIAPLVMGLGYRYDCAFGTNHEQVRDNAEAMIKRKDDRIRMVGGPLTLSEVDAYRERHFR